ncbi:hypothetical protein NIES4072_40220 [Nostoc commune NIES-4072]|uniref:Uncharacterized protein n=1 Tax=Nostoc commune NIES-4072 TaxID=2005467 RepID=A0A2R5FPY2_NOSCO|nr:hypothetical protein NIES4072_40220 [Nostoc commune NIES-4072]
MLKSQLSNLTLTFKITNFQQKSTYTGIHHGAIAKLFGLLSVSSTKVGPVISQRTGP